MKLPETYSIQAARYYADKASFIHATESSFDNGTYIKFSDLSYIGESFLRINRGLERSLSNKLRVKPVNAEENRHINHQLFEIATNMNDMNNCKTPREHNQIYAQTLRYMGNILAKDPLNPDLHLFAGRFFLDDSQKTQYETYNMPAYRNIIALLAFTNASRLHPHVTEAHQGMEVALELIKGSSDSSGELERIHNKGLKRLIKGSLFIEQGEYFEGIRLLNRVPKDSAYAWLANKKACDTLRHQGDESQAVVFASQAVSQLIKKRDDQTALPLCEFIAEQQKSADAYLELANVYQRLRMTDEALKANATGKRLVEQAKQAETEARSTSATVYRKIPTAIH